MKCAYLKESFLEVVVSEMKLERWVEYTENENYCSVVLNREQGIELLYVLGMNKVSESLRQLDF